MTVYYVNLALIFGLGMLLCRKNPSKLKTIAYLAITFGYMWFLATFRQGIGNDYQSYINIFQEVAQAERLFTMKEKWGILLPATTLPYEPGFLILTKAMTLFISSSVVMYGVYELLVLLPVAWFIYRHCRDPWLSTWLYVTLTFYYTSMNFVRQSLACSIVLLGYDFLRKKKALPFLAIVLLAMTFHRSAFIMIPVYFVCHFPLNKKLGITYAAAALVTFLFSAQILDKITDVVYSYYKNTIYTDVGLPVVFLMLPAVVFCTCLAVYPTWKKRNPDAPMFLNLMMYNFIIWLFLTRHFIVERFSMYVYIFVLVALPSALRCLCSPQEVLDQRDALKAELEKSKKNPPKDKLAKLESLEQDISDHDKYFWSAVAGLLVITLVYNDFGMFNNGFHGVFPYQSVFPWMP